MTKTVSNKVMQLYFCMVLGYDGFSQCRYAEPSSGDLHARRPIGAESNMLSNTCGILSTNYQPFWQHLARLHCFGRPHCKSIDAPPTPTLLMVVEESEKRTQERRVAQLIMLASLSPITLASIFARH